MTERECFSYIVKDDCGYAPNPWWERCTLAICKPIIRKTAKEGDLIIGLTPRSMGHELVYAMFVDEVLSLGEYYRDPRFLQKRPDFQSNDIRLWMGDNFYEERAEGYVQHFSAHNIRGRGQEILDQKKEADLKGKNVLIGSLFFYFGGDSKALPKELDFLQVGRGHRLSGSKGILKFERHAKHLLQNPGVRGSPRTLEKEAGRLTYLNESM